MVKRKTCALVRAKASALLRCKTCAVSRAARTCALLRANTKAAAVEGRTALGTCLPSQKERCVGSQQGTCLASEHRGPMSCLVHVLSLLVSFVIWTLIVHLLHACWILLDTFLRLCEAFWSLCEHLLNACLILSGHFPHTFLGHFSFSSYTLVLHCLDTWLTLVVHLL